MQSLQQELWALDGPRVLRLQEEGARQVVVYAGGRDEDESVRALYASVGFRRHTRVVEFRKAYSCSPS